MALSFKLVRYVGLLLLFAIVRCELAPEDQPVINILKLLDRNKEQLAKWASDLPLEVETKDAILTKLGTTDTRQSPVCVSCMVNYLSTVFALLLIKNVYFLHYFTIKIAFM